MSTTDVLIGLGVGAIVAITLYQYLTRRTSPKDRVKPADNELEKVNTISYDMLFTWLKDESKKMKLIAGDKFFVLQDPIARTLFIDAFPIYAKSINMSSQILCIGIMRGTEVLSSKFYFYDVMAQSLVDLLPKDTSRSFIQEICE